MTYTNSKTFLMLSLLLALSCTKEKIVEKEVPAAPAASISITSPLSENIVSNGGNVNLKAMISGVNTLHGYEIQLVKNDAEVIFFKHNHIHSQSISIDTTWQSHVSDTSDMKINITVYTDHSGNSVGKAQSYVAVP